VGYSNYSGQFSSYSHQKQALYDGIFPLYDSYDEVMKPAAALDAILNTYI